MAIQSTVTTAKKIETARFAAFNVAADRCGTFFEPSSPGFSMRIGGACTKHPLARDVAAVLIAECRNLGGEARAIDTRVVGHPEDFVYLSGCSFMEAR